MQIYVNGQPRTVTSGSTLAVLMEDLGMAGRPVALEVNRQLVPRQALHSYFAFEQADFSSNSVLRKHPGRRISSQTSRKRAR